MKTVIVVPAYNEELVLGSVLDQLTAARFSDATIVVIDDGSTDKTAMVAAKQGAFVLRHLRNVGLGAALATGIAAARRLDADIVATFDADGQHTVADLKRALGPVVSEKADVVIGSRLKSPGMPRTRWLINWVANIFTWLLYGVWTTDSQSGLRVFSRQALRVINLRTSRMEVSSEVFAEIAQHKLRFLEVPIQPVYTAYSIAKGQRLSNSVDVAWKLLLRQLRV